MSAAAAPHGVVVGADGSPSSLAAVHWAGEEARLRHVPLTIVHVVSDAGAEEEPGGEAAQVLAEAVSVGRAAVGGDTGTVVETRQLHGKPVPELVDVSAAAQLVVVGSHGRTGRRDRAVGSIGVGLLHHARCPVAIVHDDVPPKAGPGRRPILVGIDGSRTSMSAAAIAFDEASRRAADLLALHVCKDADTPAAHDPQSSTLEREAEDFLRETLSDLQQRYPEVAVHLLVRFANPSRQLLIQAERAELVVLGSHGRGALAGKLLGSVSTAVAEGSRIPVIVARRT